MNLRLASALAVTALAALPVVDGSFLVRGLTRKSQPPATNGTSPGIRVERDSGAPATPQVRCPMTTIEANPKIDPKLAKKPRQDVKFAIRLEPPPCAP